ncbi:hypothetical protein Rsub_04081 [Raphidocelis subcapitata]|uniref:EF-hand domain-containing protein n=1 Tax=Raphidocelis subcapitata TaxID=307507 RepID=A0A2V0P3J2_9CHLO|nr:hypothetical protein Rsub_04081 [Raphidocelis subcapitata]|eukprot:GBF91777.1 hypothetical protein Rsub_04081 [Raphidocelis subcapitata]
MGASSSTIRDSICATFAKSDDGGKGWLSLREIQKLQLIWGIDPGHLGVLYAVDRDRDGRVTLEEALAFARHAAALTRGQRARDTLAAVALAQGECSLAMWRALSAPGGRAAFVAWAVRMITAGEGASPPRGWDVPCVAAAAVKNLHRLFDMERRQGLLLEDFWELLLAAAEDQGLLPPAADEAGSEAGSGDGGGGGGSLLRAHTEEEEGEGEEEEEESGCSLPSPGSEGSQGSEEGGAESEAGSSSAGSAASSDAEDAGGRGGGRVSGSGQGSPARGAARRGGPAERAGSGGGGWRPAAGAAVPLEVVEAFLGAAFDGMGNIVDSIVDAGELGAVLGGGGGGGDAAAAAAAAAGSAPAPAPAGLALTMPAPAAKALRLPPAVA